MGRLRLICALALAAGLLAAPSAAAATFRVDSFDDPSPDGCNEAGCTLREAVIAARDRFGPDTVVLPPGNFYIGPPREGEAPEGGDLDLAGRLNIYGSGSRSTHLFGCDARAFEVHSARVEIRDLHIEDCYSEANGGVISMSDASAGSLRLVDVRLDRGEAEGQGGGIYVAPGASATLVRTTVNAGFAREGGGIYAAGRLTLIDSTVKYGRAAAGRGGNIASGGRLRLMRSRVSRGRAQLGGGGIWVTGERHKELLRSFVGRNLTTGVGARGGAVLAELTPLAVKNSTLWRNFARGDGGAVAAVDGADVDITSTTVVGAHAGFRSDGQTVGGAGGALFAESSRIRIEGSLLALNLSGRALDDCLGPVTSGGHNLTATPCARTTRATDILSRRPGLEPIGLYGGPTPVFALRPASPAVDAGGTSCPSLDQRGRRRRDGACDIGAFELQRGLRARAAAADPAR